ncbi:MAG: YchJ family metal-binding protein [Lapillicoccus sp.]
MRSRYTAYVLGHRDHLLRTWHPRTRPDDVDPPFVTWTGMVVLETQDGGVGHETGVVGFEAHFRDDDRDEVVRETSWFERRAGRWLYVGPLDET